MLDVAAPTMDDVGRRKVLALLGLGVSATTNTAAARNAICRGRSACGSDSSGEALPVGKIVIAIREIQSCAAPARRTSLSASQRNADAKAWFVGTELGAFAAFAQAFNVRNQVFRDRDDGPDAQETKDQIYDALKHMMKAYANKMEIAQQLIQAKRLYWRYARGAGCAQWLSILMGSRVCRQGPWSSKK